MTDHKCKPPYGEPVVACFYVDIEMRWTCPQCAVIWEPWNGPIKGFLTWRTKHPTAQAEYLGLGVEERGAYIGGDLKHLRSEISRVLSHLVTTAEALLEVLEMNYDEEQIHLEEVTHEITHLQHALKQAKAVPPLMESDVEAKHRE